MRDDDDKGDIFDDLDIRVRDERRGQDEFIIQLMEMQKESIYIVYH